MLGSDRPCRFCQPRSFRDRTEEGCDRCLRPILILNSSAVNVRPVKDGMTYSMSDLLQLMVPEGSSDLHVRVGFAPVIRVHGILQRVEGPHLRPEDSDELLRSIGRTLPSSSGLLGNAVRRPGTGESSADLHPTDVTKAILKIMQARQRKAQLPPIPLANRRCLRPLEANRNRMLTDL